MGPTEETKKNNPVYTSVRAVGTLKPQFNPNNGKVFADMLEVVGTAFWIKNTNVLVTCAHVVRKMLGAPLEVTGILVVGNSGNYRRAIIDVIDTQHDLAVLRLLDKSNNLLSGQELKEEACAGLTLVETYTEVGTSISFAGFPLGNQLLDKVHSPTYSEGVVGVSERGNARKKEIQITGPVVGGFSGSPVVVKGTDQLLGVVSNGPNMGNSTSNIFMAISWEHVKNIVRLATGDEI